MDSDTFYGYNLVSVIQQNVLVFSASVKHSMTMLTDRISEKSRPHTGFIIDIYKFVTY